MSVAALLFAIATATAAPPPPGAVLDSAQVTVTILKPVAVRQDGGPSVQPESPRYPLTRRVDTVLVEFK